MLLLMLQMGLEALCILAVPPCSYVVCIHAHADAFSSRLAFHFRFYLFLFYDLKIKIRRSSSDTLSHACCGVAYLCFMRRCKQVILSSGAVNSPQLLMLSGVGPADDLQRHNIPLVHHLPGVGRNLQDHLEVFVQYRCTQPLTLYRYQVPTSQLESMSDSMLQQFG